MERISGRHTKISWVKPRAHSASGRSEENEFGLMRGNKELGQKECVTIHIMIARLICLRGGEELGGNIMEEGRKKVIFPEGF